MGYFSWKTSDTKETIWNKHTGRAETVYLYCPDGKKIKEDDYDGYGVFGGKDAYALLAKWNAPDECTGNVDHDRGIGIDLTYGDKPLKFELKFSFSPSETYNGLEPAEQADNQGFFDEEEDEEEEEYMCSDCGNKECICEDEVDACLASKVKAEVDPLRIKKLASLLKRSITKGIEMRPYTQYSGRGMMGLTCYGVILDRSDYNKLVASLEKSDIGFNSDNLGMDFIVYFRWVKYENIKKYLPEELKEEIEEDMASVTASMPKKIIVKGQVYMLASEVSKKSEAAWRSLWLKLDKIDGCSVCKPQSWGDIQLKVSASRTGINELLKTDPLPEINADKTKYPLEALSPKNSQYYIVKVPGEGKFLVDNQGYDYGRYWIRLSV